MNRLSAARSSLLPAVLCGLLAIGASPLPADEGEVDGQDIAALQPTLAELLDRVHAIADGGKWRAGDWSDPVLEGWLDRAVGAVRECTGRDSLRLPVRFDEVEAQAGQAVRTEDSLHVVRNGNFAHAHRAILLADGNLDVAFANDCILIARGSVTVAHGNRNVILAGCYAEVSHDGHDGGREREVPGQGTLPPSFQDGSLIVSGAHATLGFAHGSICVAPGSLDVAHARRAHFINSPARRVSHEADSESIENERLAQMCRVKELDLGGFPDVTDCVRKGDSAFVLFQGDRVEYAVREGSPLCDEDGQPIPRWENWLLTRVGDEVAVFSNGERHVSVRVGAQ